MKIIFKDKKSGLVKIKIESFNDLWHLSKILKKGDRVSSSTTRSVRINDKEDRKRVFITIEIEDMHFDKEINRLRLRGRILEGKPEEFVQVGRYHTLDIREGSELKIIKEWKMHEWNRLFEAEKESKKPKINVVVMDEEKALFAEIKGYGIEPLTEIYFRGSKRDEGYESQRLKYYGDIAAEIERLGGSFIVAGPGFAKDNLKKFIEKRKPELLKNIFWTTVSNAEISGVHELLKNKTVDKILGEERIKKEEELMNKFLENLHKGLPVAYGLKEVREAADSYAIDELLVLDRLIRENDEVEELLDMVEKAGGRIHVFSEESNPGERLKGFGGIAATLRFSLS